MNRQMQGMGGLPSSGAQWQDKLEPGKARVARLAIWGGSSIRDTAEWGPATRPRPGAEGRRGFKARASNARLPGGVQEEPEKRLRGAEVRGQKRLKSSASMAAWGGQAVCARQECCGGPSRG